MLYAVCEKLARARPSWFVARRNAVEWGKVWRQGHAERMADKLFVATWRADRGANHAAASADIMFVGQFARHLRADWTPAEALRSLRPEDFS